MTAVAPVLESFFTQRLMTQRQANPQDWGPRAGR
jgi:hypothetical protein